jgi:Tol biopolymer transport system component
LISPNYSKDKYSKNIGGDYMYLKYLFSVPIWLRVIFILSASLWGCSKDIIDKTETINYENLSGKMAFSRSDGKIVIIDADKKNTTTVTTKDNASIWNASISLSPDGNMIAYAAYYYTYSGYQIFTMSVDGGNYAQLTANSGHNFCPIWNADGTQLFYIYGAANSGQINNILSNGSNNSKITDFEAYGRISVSKDGNLLALAFSKHEFDSPKGIFLYNIKNDSLKQITSNDSTISAYSPVLSPDDQKIVFVLRHGLNEQGTSPYFFKIMTVNIDGSDEKMVIELPFVSYLDDTYVTWSPDGTKLAFNYGSGMNDDQWSHIFLINSDGSGLTQITHNTNYDGAPSWIK